jgi:hypothetical protein
MSPRHSFFAQLLSIKTIHVINVNFASVCSTSAESSEQLQGNSRGGFPAIFFRNLKIEIRSAE